MWKTPRRKAFIPSGITLGATVTGSGAAQPWQSSTSGITGQVWSRARGARMWWVVATDQHAYLMHESTMAVLGQCSDAALFDVEAA